MPPDVFCWVVICVPLTFTTASPYLSRLFRKYSDTTFNAYLTRRRIEAALKLLQEHPDFLLRDIAACVGYEDASYFSKVFHQYTGFSPSQYTNKTDHEE